jgi:hypothetical protein
MIMDNQDEMKDSFSTVRTFLPLDNKKYIPFRTNENYGKIMVFKAEQMVIDTIFKSIEYFLHV